MKEEQIGEITHFFPHIPAGVIKIKKELKVGDTIHIKGHTTDLTQAIDSMQIDNASVKEGKKGDDVAIKLKERVRINDLVYKVIEE
jgi:predicted ribosome-associated RNA-binding protein Tma20